VARLVWLLVVTALMAVGVPARAAEGESDDSLSHARQFGLRMGFSFGYEIDFRYDRSPYCTRADFTPSIATVPNAKAPQPHGVCGFGAPPAIELALSFAPFGGVEPFIFTRLGLGEETETLTAATKMIGAGARIYAMNDSRLKVFIEPAVGAALEGTSNTNVLLGLFTPNAKVTEGSYKTDFVFHVGIGPQYDIVRYAGVYASGNVDVGVLRALSMSLSAQAGVQARFP
jgi:hypothetical protein